MVMSGHLSSLACWPASLGLQGFEPLNRACLPFSQLHRQCPACTQLDVHHFLWRLALLLPRSVAGLRFVLAWAVPLLFKSVPHLCTAFSYGVWLPYDLARFGPSLFSRPSFLGALPSGAGSAPDSALE